MWFMMVAIIVGNAPLLELPLESHQFVNEDACLDYGSALNERFDSGVEGVRFGFKCVKLPQSS